MKKLTFTLAFACICLLSQAQNKMNLDTESKKLSYSLGVVIGNNLKTNGFENLDEQVFSKALGEVMKGQSTQFSNNQADSLINAYMMAKKAKAQSQNIEKGKAFLAENKKKKGVYETASGLQYEVIKMGNGPKPTAADKVTTHYHGTLLDGKVFDSSVDRGQPIQFPLNGVIAGWTEGLQLMPVGSKFRFYIPSNLAYGERGAGGSIGPNETLIFDVELISIDK